MKIMFFDTKKYDRTYFNEYNESNKIKFIENKLTTETASLTAGYDAVCVFVNDSITNEVIDTLVENGVKIIALRCAGYNNVDLEYASKKLKVVRVPAYSPYSVAEHTIGMILTLNRKLHKAYSKTRDGNFSLDGLLGFDLYKKKVGIIGTGKIARTFIKILNGFQMDIIAYDPYPNREAEKELGFRYTNLDEIFRTSDIISLHCPLTPETKYIINDDSIDKMKDGVMIVNTGRGLLIETIDLIEGLKSGKVGAAALDVYEEESDFFFEDFSQGVISDDILGRLLSFNNVLVTSHQAFFTEEALQEIAKVTLNNLKEFEDGKELTNEVRYDQETGKIID